MANSASAVYELRSAGNDTNNGGGFDASVASPGTDYSQQDSVQTTLTSGTTSGASATVLHASAAASHVGNIVQLSGTLVTSGFYTIISAVANTSLTMDRVCSSGSASSITVRIGGALATHGKIGAVVVAGNIVYQKGALTRTTNNDTYTTAGTAANPITIIGYTTARTDAYVGRTGNTGNLVTANMASITYTSGQLTTAAFYVVKNLTVTGAKTAAANLILGANNVIQACSISNTDATFTTSKALSLNTTRLYDCDLSLPNTAGTCLAGTSSPGTSEINGCHITATTGTALAMAFGVSIKHSLIYGCATGIALTTAAGAIDITNVTITGCSGKAINVSAYTSVLSIANCMLTDNTGVAIDCGATSNVIGIENTFFRNNNSGSGDFANQSTSYKEVNNTHQAGGSAYVDYNNQAGGDYSLAASSPAKQSILPYGLSPGCFQYVAPASSPIGQRTGPVSMGAYF